MAKLNHELRARRLEEFARIPRVRLLLRHGKLGIITLALGLGSGVLVVLAHEIRIPPLADYVWGALLSIPATIICMGLFSVFYEYYMRTSFADAMRSVYGAWDSGVTVFPTHTDAPDRKQVLLAARTHVRLMSTTFMRYFTDVREMVDQKAQVGVHFQFIVYDPTSKAVEEKAREEACDPEDFKQEIISTCRRFLGPLYQKYPEQIKVRFCTFNAPFGITIVDDCQMVLSLNVYGQARSKNQTPCLTIENKYRVDSVFKLYETSFDTIWNKLDDQVPTVVANFFGIRQAPAEGTENVDKIPAEAPGY